MPAQMRKPKAKSKKSKVKKSKPKPKSRLDLDGKLVKFISKIVNETLDKREAQQALDMSKIFQEEVQQVEKNMKEVEKHQADVRVEALKGVVKGIIAVESKRKALKAERLSKTKLKPIQRKADKDIPQEVKVELQKINPMPADERRKLFTKLLKKHDGDVEKVKQEMWDIDMQRVAYKRSNIKRIIAEV
jgi:small-conductance mechanosensitive channel